MPPRSVAFRSNEDLDRSGVAEECGRARGQAVGAGLEHGDEVADLGGRQDDVVAQQSSGVQRQPTTVTASVASSSMRLAMAIG